MSQVLIILFLLLYSFTIVSSILVVLLENRNPVKSVSWILILLLLPGFGLLFYFLFGQDYGKKKAISQKSIQHLTNHPTVQLNLDASNFSTLNDNQHNLIKLLANNSRAVCYSSNKIEVFSDGESTFDAFFDSIRNAKDHIHIEFFIFANDEISNRMRELLIEKAKEGITVRMIYDFLGSFQLAFSAGYLKSLKEAGVLVAPFLPLGLRLGRSRINYRNHRKIAVIDGKTGFTGGFNVADRYLKGNKLGLWRDTVVRIEGEAVHGLQMLFLLDWYFVEKQFILDDKYFPPALKFDNNLVQIVASGPDTDWDAIMQGIASTIMSAKKYVYIHSPYFIPSELVLGCIQMAALSGVDVRLMIPERSDSSFTDASTTSYLGQILEAKVRVFRYSNGVLHSKAIVVDDCISIVGSANMDQRSFSQNFEANAFIYDETTALHLKGLFFNDMGKCQEYTFVEWNKRTRWKKIKESFARLFSPLL